MAKNIKGITIELDGDSTGLTQALKDVDKETKSVQTELKTVDRLLKFDPGNVTLLVQKQELLADAVDNTSKRLDVLKQAQSQVEEQFRNGEVGADQYRAFQREIVATEGQLNAFKKKLSQVGTGDDLADTKKEMSKFGQLTDEAKNSVRDLGGELTGLAAGLVAGGGITGVVEKALDTSSLNTKIEISMEVPPESVETVKSTVNDVTAVIGDQEAALEGVRRQWALNKDASDETNAAVVQSAATIASAYAGIDFMELIQETNEIANELGISNEEALGLTNSLLKMGFPPEQLDIIAEYGKQLTDAGFNAQEVQAIMAAGVETGTWNIDNLLDGLKEGRIKLTEFGQEVPKATSELLQGTDISSKQLQQWGQEVAKGGETGRTAMQEVAKALLNVKDETQRNALGVQFFGTMWEDQGANITDTLLNMDDHLMSAQENQTALNDATSKLDSSPAVQMQQAMADLKEAMQPLLEIIANIISKIAEWVSNNPTLTATIVAIVSAIGILMGIFLALSPIITAITTLAGALGVGIGAIAAPVLIAVAVIAALIAIGIALWKNWDEIKAKAAELVKNIQEKFEEFKSAVAEKMKAAKDKIVEIWNSVMDFFEAIDIKETAKKIFVTFINGIAAKIVDTVSKVKELWTKVTNFLDGISIIDIAKKIITTFVNGIGEKITNVTSKVKELWDGAKGFLEGIDLLQIGKNIIQGLINGIGSMKKFVMDIIEDTIGSAIDFAKKLLGIKSPSRVFMEIGEFTNEGFIEGINNSSKRLTNAVDGVYGSLASSAQKSITNASYTTNNYNSSGGSQVITIMLDSEVIGRAVAPIVGEEIVLQVGRW